jgi:hypothetical protein
MRANRGAHRVSRSYWPPRIVDFGLLQYMLQFEIPTKRTAELIEARRRRQFIRFSRRFESSKICGYVLDVGPQFFLLALVSDRLWFDGFECFASPMSRT